MFFFQLHVLKGLLLAAFVFYDTESHERAEAHHHDQSSDIDDLHLQIASEAPIISTVDALDCVSGAADRTLKRNTRLNSQTGGVQMMDANELMMGEAQELKDEAGLHERRAQEIEGIKQRQKGLHNTAMRKIQDDQAEIGDMEHQLELIKKAESTAKRDLAEERQLLNDAEAHAAGNKEMRLQQQKSRHKTREEIAALMHYPLLGFSMPAALNPVEYLSKFSQGKAAPQGPSKASHTSRIIATDGTRKRLRNSRRQALEDQAEILGADARLNELEKAEGETKKDENAKKSHKEKKENKESSAADDSSEELSPTKVLGDLEKAVTAPFGGGKANSDSSDSLVTAEKQEAECQMEDPLEESKDKSIFAENATDDDDDDDDDDENKNKKKASEKTHKNTFFKKSTGKIVEDKDEDDHDDDDKPKDRRMHKGTGGEKSDKRNRFLKKSTREGEDDEPVERHKHKKHHKEKHGNNKKEEHKTTRKSPVEASEAETGQAKALQRQVDLAQQKPLQQIDFRENQRVQQATPASNERIKAAIDAGRMRFAAARAAASSVSDNDETDDDDDEEPSGVSELEKENDQPKDISQVAAAAPVEGKAMETEALATEEAEALKEAQAVEKEAQETEASLEDEHKLLAAEQEADQAKNGLRICAEGSFLNCPQAKRAKRPQRKAATRVVH